VRVSGRIAWISVALSIAVMVIAVAVVGGFKAEIRAKATGFMGSAVLCRPGQGPLNEQYPFNGALSYLDSLRALPEVTSVSPVAYRSGMIRHEGEIGGAWFKGVDSLYDFSFFADALSEGALPDYSGRISPDVLLSARLAAQLGLAVGDTLNAYFVREELKARNFRVCGLFDAQLEEIDNAFILTDLRHIRRLSGWAPEEVSALEVRIRPGADIEAAVDHLTDVEFRLATDDDAPLFIHSVKKIYPHLFDWLAVLDLNVVMILALMMIVAGFNMISSLLILLFRKISMIGVLKSLGMRDGALTRVFLIRSARVVGKGLLWGDLVALALCLIQKYGHVFTLDPANYFVKYVPIQLDWGAFLLLNLLSAVVILAVLSLSAVFIARVSPSRTLRAA
jgi:lipoprotein-releasing system permease protein